MAEKILNTRIQLKYDTYTDWTTANTLLKEGEIAIVEIPGSSYTKHEGDKAITVQNPPHILFKVGPGNFNDLDWTSAKAADVFAWAKESSLTINKEGTGNVVSGIEWDASANGGKGGIKFTTAAVATSEGLGNLQDKVDEIEQDIADNRAAWAKDDNTTYTVAKTNKGFTFTPSEGDASTITFDYLTEAEIKNLVSSIITSGSVNGTIAVNGKDVAVKGLGSAAYTSADSYAPADIDTGVHAVSLTSGTNNGTVKLTVDGTSTDNIAVKGLQDAAYVTVESLNKTAKGYADAVETGVENGTIKAKTAEHADAATKVDAAITVKVGGENVVFDGSAAKTADVDAAIAAGVAEAKQYADAKPHENTAHTHSAGAGTKVSAAGGINGDVKVNLNVAFELVDKTIKLYDKDDTSKTAIATLDATEFIADGMLSKVEADEANNKIVFTWNTDAGITTTEIPFDKIADIYTGGANSEVSVAVSNTNEITATLVNKGVTEEKLEQDVQDALALARTALQSHQDISGKKNVQTAVTNKISKAAHVLTFLSQNTNGDISYDVKELTYTDIGAEEAGTA